MKRQTFEKKMRNLYYQMNIANKELSQEGQWLKDYRVKRPNFGYILKTGKYSGVPLISYAMMWDSLKDAFKGTSIGDKI